MNSRNRYLMWEMIVSYLSHCILYKNKHCKKTYFGDIPKVINVVSNSLAE